MTHKKYNDIYNTIALNSIAHDLAPLAVKVNNSTISAGTRLSDMNYMVYNDGSQTWKGTVEARVYLSSNDYISTSDRLIDMPHQFSTYIEPNGAIKVSVPPPLIPKNISGKHWIGVILTVSNDDPNSDNNITQYSDAAPITIDSPVSLPESDSDPSTSLKPQRFSLGNAPNPFNPITHINFELPIKTKVKLVIYNSLGEQVGILVNNKHLAAGPHHYPWNASLLPSGFYFAQIYTEKGIKTHKMLLLK